MQGKNTVVWFLVMMVLFVAPTYGQKVWEKKPFKQWTEAETLKILTDSPWAQTAIQTTHSSYNVPGAAISAIIRLRSALPLRQALVRQRQFIVNYDKLSSGDQARFDAETKVFLDCPNCTKYYLITLVSATPVGTPPSTVPGIGTLPGDLGYDIGAALKSMTLDTIKSHVHLSNDSGEQRALVGFVPPAREGAEAMFIFERFDAQGKPLITTSTKEFHFKIDEQVFKNMVMPLKKFTFQVSKLIQNNEVIF